MSRLPNLSARQVLKIFQRAGFVVHAKVGSHFTLLNPTTLKRTTISMHSGDLKRPLLKAMIKQAGLTEEEFRKLI